jgi:hypothetical protein
LAEQGTLNPKVVGSTPTGRTKVQEELSVLYEIKKRLRGDVSYVIDTAPNEEIAKQRCRAYVKQSPEAELRIWNATDGHWVLWYPETEKVAG